MIIKCKVKGLDKLEKKIKTMIKNLPKTIEASVEDIIKNIRGYSIRLEKGHNEEGILVEMIENSMSFETDSRQNFTSNKLCKKSNNEIILILSKNNDQIY